jgi:hypothetical protein
MIDENLNNVLSGMVVLLLIVVVARWYSKNLDMNGYDMRLSCGCNSGKCKCRTQAPVQYSKPACNKQHNHHSQGFASISDVHKEPIEVSYQEMTEKMGLEASVTDSHKSYINSFSGLPTGSSSDVELEETGRSYGTADFHGLTARKWCKARNLVQPAEDARVVPSDEPIGNCHISLTDLI